MHVHLRDVRGSHCCTQVSGSDDVFSGMARTLKCFRTWLDGGNGGSGWSLEPENYEGWRVVVDEGANHLCRPITACWQETFR